MKIKIIMLGFMSFLFFNNPSLSAVWIDGIKYPDGCVKSIKIINGIKYSGISCPRIGVNTYIENAKRVNPPSFGGYPSTQTYNRKKDKGPVLCRAAEKRMGKNLSKFLNWLNLSINGAPEQRVLTEVAAEEVAARVRHQAIQMMDRGISIYNHRIRGEDGDKRCEIYLNKANEELLKVISLVKSEAKKGNRDLSNTGLNPYGSVYNN